MNRIDIWKALSDKEAGNLKKLHLKREAFNFEKIRIENKVLDIESYIYEYKSSLQDDSEMNSGMQRIHQKMNMISQLSDVRSKLMRNKLECIENIKIMRRTLDLLVLTRTRSCVPLRLSPLINLDHSCDLISLMGTLPVCGLVFFYTALLALLHRLAGKPTLEICCNSIN